MSASSIVSSTVDFKAADRDPPAAKGRVAGPTAENQKPKHSRRRLLIFFTIGLLSLVGIAFWYINNAGYETTDDATIEAHVIQVSPKISAHVKAVHFGLNGDYGVFARARMLQAFGLGFLIVPITQVAYARLPEDWKAQRLRWDTLNAIRVFLIGLAFVALLLSFRAFPPRG
jgi:hypothetical protein